MALVLHALVARLSWLVRYNRFQSGSSSTTEDYGAINGCVMLTLSVLLNKSDLMLLSTLSALWRHGAIVNMSMQKVYLWHCTSACVPAKMFLCWNLYHQLSFPSTGLAAFSYSSVLQVHADFHLDIIFCTQCNKH